MRFCILVEDEACFYKAAYETKSIDNSNKAMTIKILQNGSQQTKKLASAVQGSK